MQVSKDLYIKYQTRLNQLQAAIEELQRQSHLPNTERVLAALVERRDELLRMAARLGL